MSHDAAAPSTAARYTRPWGAFVISLDFELHWGLRDHEAADAPYRRNLIGVRQAIPEILALFARHGVSATWATVGFLFARDREELFSVFPALRPSYHDPRLSPFSETVGRDEKDDPLHFAPSLIDQIRNTPGQEIGSHTLSHYYCLEGGQTIDQFRADVCQARALGASRGLDLVSLVLPRNQLNTAYASAVRDAGFLCFRGNQRSWVYTPASEEQQPLFRRAARMLDTYVSLTGTRTFDFAELPSASGLLNVRASHFLRPTAPGHEHRNELQLRRIGTDLAEAARDRRVFHLWWHPHNFGRYPKENIALLDRIVLEFRRLQDRWGMRSLSMGTLGREMMGHE